VGPVAITVIRDVEDRARLVSALRHSEERYRLLVENASEVFFRVRVPEEEGPRIEFVSRQCEKITGHPAQDFLHDPELGLRCIHPDDRDTVRARTEDILRSQEAGTRTYRIRNLTQGEYRWVDDRIIPWVESGGRVGGFQGVARDVTERIRLEEERELLGRQLHQAKKMEAIGRLAGGVAHDFNNLLTVIIGTSQLGLETTPPDSPSHADFQEILAAARRGATLTQQLLAYGRLQPNSPRVLDLNAQLTAVESMLRRIIGEDIELTLSRGRDVSPVRLDPFQFDQIVVNLAVNARDAMPNGGALDISTTNTVLSEAYCLSHVGAIAGDYVLLTVSDTGCGMDQETQEHVFEPFFTTKAEGKGTGLGLAMIYGIVKQNRGYVDLYSEPGRGTTVRIYLPCYQGGESVQGETFHPPTVGGTETVLLVEDNLQLRRLSGRLLERLGYTVLEGRDPEHALALCGPGGYDGEIHLLLTDVIMPSMNGARLAEAVVRLRPGIRVMFMSGYPADYLGRQGMLETGIHHLQKPFDANELARKIRETLAE
jgi:PAS domain S-box-containing protein